MIPFLHGAKEIEWRRFSFRFRAREFHVLELWADIIYASIYRYKRKGIRRLYRVHFQVIPAGFSPQWGRVFHKIGMTRLYLCPWLQPTSFYSLPVSTSFCHESLKEKHIYILEDQRPFFAARHTSRSTSFCGEIPDSATRRTQQKTLLKAQVFAHPFAALLGTVTARVLY